MVKRILKKLLVVILIVLILNNFFISQVQAFSADDIVKTIEGVLGGIVGLLSFPFRLVAILLGDAVNFMTAVIAYTEKPTDTSIDTDVLTPFDILYNKVPILDINFFEIGDEENIVNQMRTGVATWYYVMRILASAILLVIFIYVGIRMAISTVASDKAMYKKMLVDWVCSLALIFVIQYIIIFVININNALVNAMSLTMDSEQIAETIAGIQEESMKVFSLNAIGATVIFCMLVWQTIGLFVAYFNRMLKLAFLIIISPLITLTYSIDKMGDGKAQALNKWLKEFSFTILIQPFHCIIYMSLIDVAFKMLTNNFAESGSDRKALATAIVAILCVKFVKEAEKIVRKIFAFQDDNSNTSLVAGLATSALVLGNAKNLGKSARKAVNSVKNIGKGGMNLARSANVEARAAFAMITHMNDKEKKSFSERKEEVRTNLNEKKAEKINNKYKSKVSPDIVKRAKEIRKASNNTITASKALEQARQEKVNKRKEEIKERAGGAIGDKEAESMAKLELAKEKRTKNSTIRRNISYAKGKINDVKNTVGQSETLRELGGLVRTSLTGGAALMVGSGIYGTEGNIATSIMTGTAVHKGMQEYLKSSSKTLVGGGSENLKNLGATNPSEARKEIDEILANKAKYAGGEDSVKELNDILKKLESAINESDKQKYDTNIKNTITDSITDSPLVARQAIVSKLQGIRDKDGNSILESDEGKKLLIYTDRNAFVTQMNNAENAGISNNEFVSSVINGFAENRTYDEINNDKKAEKQVKEYIKEVREGKKDSELLLDYSNISITAKERIKEIFNDEIKRYNNDFSYSNKSQELRAKIEEKQEEVDKAIKEALFYAQAEQNANQQNLNNDIDNPENDGE